MLKGSFIEQCYKVRMMNAKSTHDLEVLQGELCNELEMPYEFPDIQDTWIALLKIEYEKDEEIKKMLIDEHIKEMIDTASYYKEYGMLGLIE